MLPMEDVQVELKKWLSDYCGNVQEYEYKVRTLINQNKLLTTNIKSAYSSRDIVKIKEMIKVFLIKKEIWIETCNNCKKVNYISGRYKPNEKFINRKCEQCNQSLFNNEDDDYTLETKKCIYCNSPVLPPNTLTCYTHNSVGFNY